MTSRLNSVIAKSVLHLIKSVKTSTFYTSCLMVLTIAFDNNYNNGFNVLIVSMLD